MIRYANGTVKIFLSKATLCDTLLTIAICGMTIRALVQHDINTPLSCQALLRSSITHFDLPVELASTTSGSSYALNVLTYIASIAAM